jgi:8-oxo-dGTP diphosphatase
MASPDVFAAGGIVWRPSDEGWLVGLIHRNRYGGDTSLPKGKLEAGETVQDAALREVREELGCVCELGAFAGALSYPVKNGQKYVFYFHMRWLDNDGTEPDGREVTSRSWLSCEDARAALSYHDEAALVPSAPPPGIITSRLDG